MNMRRVAAFLATLGPIGYLPAPGTVATFVTVPFVFWAQSNLTLTQFSLLLLALSLFSFFIIRYSMSLFKKYDDPSEVVLDEVVGCFITFWGLPLCAPIVILGLLLFRFFDITKLGFIKRLETVGGATGIMLDDIAAAIITNLLLRLVMHACL